MKFFTTKKFILKKNSTSTKSLTFLCNQFKQTICDYFFACFLIFIVYLILFLTFLFYFVLFCFSFWVTRVFCLIFVCPLPKNKNTKILFVFSLDFTCFFSSFYLCFDTRNKDFICFFSSFYLVFDVKNKVSSKIFLDFLRKILPQNFYV